MRILKPLFLLVIIFAAGCVILPHPKTSQPQNWQARQNQLKSINNWEVTGSIGVIYANKSDIAHFDWQQQKQNYSIDIHGPLNLGSALIKGSPGLVTMQQSENRELHAKNPESLIKREFGWTLPVSNLRYWILALPAPTKIASMQLDSENHLISLQQQGWQIEYSDFQNIYGIDLPSKIKMQQQNLKIKLAIKSWNLSSTNL